MKSIILAIQIIVALTASINFEQDTNEDSWIGFLTKGHIDPDIDGNAKMETFLRLADQLIPIAVTEATAKAEQGQKLGYGNSYCLKPDSSHFNLCFSFNAELSIGWDVLQTGGPGSWIVLYTPFTFFRVRGSVYFTSYPAEIGVSVYYHIADLTIPFVSSIGENNACWTGRFNLAPSLLLTYFYSILLECDWELTPLSPGDCSYDGGPVLPLYGKLIGEGYKFSMFDKCLDFTN